MIGRRFLTLGRFVAIVLLGPLIGGIVFFLIGLAIEPDILLADPNIVEFAFVILMFGWLFGLFPAVLAAVAWGFTPQPQTLWLRAGLAVGVGAVSGMLGFLVLSVMLGMDREFEPLLSFAVCGGLALLVTGTRWRHRAGGA